MIINTGPKEGVKPNYATLSAVNIVNNRADFTLKMPRYHQLSLARAPELTFIGVSHREAALLYLDEHYRATEHDQFFWFPSNEDIADIYIGLRLGWRVLVITDRVEVFDALTQRIGEQLD